MNNKPLKAFDLFAGYGGFTLALERVYANVSHTQRVQQRGLAGNGSLPVDKSAELASEPLCIGFSEIDKYASAVLKYHWPNTKNYGDIKKINWDKVPDFDLLTGGSPCQDLSIAGKRQGLKGERSGLFTQFMRAVREKEPKYFIWENVRGALSSQKGWDFGTVLNEMAEAGYSLWWQVCNAKDYGVPQNRERIFVVGTRADLGSAREVFFERESDGINTRENAQGNEVAYCLNAGGDKHRGSYVKEANGVNNPSRGYEERKDGLACSLRAGESGTKNIIKLNNPTHSNNRPHSDDGISPALNTAQGGNRQPKIIAHYGHKDKPAVEMDISPTLKAQSHGHEPMIRDGRDNRSCLRAGRTPELGFTGHSIRRLTPTECERLMGLPDNHLKYGINEKGEQFEISDTQKYKLAGNGVCVPVVEEIIKQIIL